MINYKSRVLAPPVYKARKDDFMLLKMPELFSWNPSGIAEFKSRNDEYLRRNGWCSK